MPTKDKKWIQKAVPKSHEGRLRRKAEKAGMGTMEYARAHKRDKGKTGQQARLALTFGKMKKRK